MLRAAHSTESPSNELDSAKTEETLSDASQVLAALLADVVPGLSDPALARRMRSQIIRLQNSLQEATEPPAALPTISNTAPEPVSLDTASGLGGYSTSIKDNRALIDLVVEQTAGRLGSLERRINYGRSVQIVLETAAIGNNGATLELLAEQLRRLGGISAEKVVSVCQALHLLDQQDGRYTLTDSARKFLS